MWQRHPRAQTPRSTGVARHRRRQDVPGAGSRVSAVGIGRSAAERCSDNLHSLCVLAHLYTNERLAAEGQALAAAATVRQDPVGSIAGQPRLWRVLADHVHAANERSGAPSPQPASLSRRQREVLAIVAVSESPQRAAWLLGVPLEAVYQDIGDGVLALDAVERRGQMVGRGGSSGSHRHLGLPARRRSLRWGR